MPPCDGRPTHTPSLPPSSLSHLSPLSLPSEYPPEMAVEKFILSLTLTLTPTPRLLAPCSRGFGLRWQGTAMVAVAVVVGDMHLKYHTTCRRKLKACSCKSQFLSSPSRIPTHHLSPPATSQLGVHHSRPCSTLGLVSSFLVWNRALWMGVSFVPLEFCFQVEWGGGTDWPTI
jgi:hypothetical protein